MAVETSQIGENNAKIHPNDERAIRNNVLWKNTEPTDVNEVGISRFFFFQHFFFCSILVLKLL